MPQGHDGEQHGRRTRASLVEELDRIDREVAQIKAEVDPPPKLSVLLEVFFIHMTRGSAVLRDSNELASEEDLEFLEAIKSFRDEIQKHVSSIEKQVRFVEPTEVQRSRPTNRPAENAKQIPFSYRDDGEQPDQRTEASVGQELDQIDREVAELTADINTPSPDLCICLEQFVGYMTRGSAVRRNSTKLASEDHVAVLQALKIIRDDIKQCISSAGKRIRFVKPTDTQRSHSTNRPGENAKQTGPGPGLNRPPPPPPQPPPPS
ncbi:hypothetical protein CIB48_g12290, partial [Xylaria polymorpha]